MSPEKQGNLIVQVQANARQNKVVGFQNGVLQVRIAAPPIKGRANKELIEFLSQLLGISKTSLRIERGLTSKTKIIAVGGLGPSQIVERLGVQHQL